MSNLFHSEDLEECKFVWNGLNIEKTGYDEPTNIYDYISQINEVLIHENLHHGISNKEALLKIQVSYIKEKISVTDNLNWIDIKNERLCYWLWKTIQTIQIDLDKIENYKFESNNSRQSTPYHDKPFSYESLGLPLNLFTTVQRYTNILRFFELWNHGLEEKELTINQLQQAWHEVLCLETFFWITKKESNQEKKEEWFFNYMANKLPNINFWAGALLKGINVNENLINAIGYFDVWPATHPAEKKLFIQSMKKAWAQKKHRDKMQGRKAYSMVMSTDIKEKLDSMSIDSDMHRNELLEEMIKHCHEQYKKGSLKFSKW